MGFLFGSSVALADAANTVADTIENYPINFGDAMQKLLATTGFGAFGTVDGLKMLVMIVIGCVLIFLAIHKQYEPLLLLPIGFGMVLANLPLAGLMAEPVYDATGHMETAGGLLYYLYQGVKLRDIPPADIPRRGRDDGLWSADSQPQVAVPGRGGAAGHIRGVHRRAGDRHGPRPRRR